MARRLHIVANTSSSSEAFARRTNEISRFVSGIARQGSELERGIGAGSLAMIRTHPELRAFAREGAKIAIADIDEKQAQKVAKKAKETGAADAIVVKTDVTDLTAVEAMVKQVKDKYGPVDIMLTRTCRTTKCILWIAPRSRCVR
jgi:hypothetical protein